MSLFKNILGVIMVNFENLDKYNFLGVKPYDIPKIHPEKIDIHKIEWIPFNYAKKCPDEFDWNVVKIKAHYEQIVERRKEKKWAVEVETEQKT